MSLKVDLGELAEQMRHYGFAYLLTVGDDQRAHAVAVRPSLDGGRIRVVGLGRSTLANLEARPGISLVWPPFEHGGYSLIVDGTATTDGQATSIEPDHAVLHRPAEDGGHDCVQVGQVETA